MDQKKRYLHFLSDALLSEDVNARKIHRHLRSLQKQDPVDTPLSSRDSLEDWYQKQHMPHTVRQKRISPRIWIGSVSAIAAVLLLFIVLSDGNFYNHKYAEHDTADGVMEEAAAETGSTKYEDAEDTEDEMADAVTEEAPEDTAEDAVCEEEALQSGSTGVEALWNTIQEQYASGMDLSFTSAASAVQDQPGYLLMTDICLAFSDPDAENAKEDISSDWTSAGYAGKTLQISCEAGSYEPDFQSGTIYILNTEGLSITIIE